MTLIRVAFRAWSAVLPLLRTAPPVLVAASVCLQCAVGVSPLLFILFSSAAVGRVQAAVAAGISSSAWDVLQRYLVLSALTLVVSQVLAPLQRLVARVIQLRVDAELYARVITATFSSPEISAIERPDVRVAIDEAVDGLGAERRSGGAAAAATLSLLARYVSFLGALVLVGVEYSWLAGLLAAVAGLALRRAHRTGFAAYHAAALDSTHSRRRHWHLRKITLSPAIGKESRVFGLAEWLADRTTAAGLDYYRPLWRARDAIFIRPFLRAGAVAVVGCTLALAGMAWPAIGGGVSVGKAVLVAQAVIVVLGIGAFFDDSDVETSYGTENLRHIERVEAISSQPVGGAAEPPRVERALRFEAVSFTYPGASKPVLSELTLEIEAGRSLALVGINGAGKSTLIKLLCRFYTPGEGRITVDGVDLVDVDAGRWQRQIAAVFQDFGRYPLSAFDNIGFGSAQLGQDRERVRRAAQRAGAVEYLDGLNHGLDTTLSREYTEGTDLSSGQWQRIALARALLAVDAGASLLILDEPTASLDVRAEAEFIEHFLDLAKGLTTIVVSHRFATVRQADRIVVLEGGRIAENGSHDDLMAAGGRYAEMFTVQAQRFAQLAREDG
jgi:ATP-binding cassette, subfamily B, bacterial